MAFILGCLTLDVYGFFSLKKCDREVQYVKKLSHRVIGKVQLVRKIHEIGAFLGFGFFVTFGLIFMWFWGLESHVQSTIGNIITTGLVVGDALFALLFMWSINTYQRICEL